MQKAKGKRKKRKKFRTKLTTMPETKNPSLPSRASRAILKT
jgi:hypothetical protein